MRRGISCADLGERSRGRFGGVVVRHRDDDELGPRGLTRARREEEQARRAVIFGSLVSEVAIDRGGGAGEASCHLRIVGFIGCDRSGRREAVETHAPRPPTKRIFDEVQTSPTLRPLGPSGDHHANSALARHRPLDRLDERALVIVWAGERSADAGSAAWRRSSATACATVRAPDGLCGSRTASPSRSSVSWRGFQAADRTPRAHDRNHHA